MARTRRIELIKEIAKRRKSVVLCYITGDRENVNTRIAPDVITVFYRHLQMMGGRPRIDLLLYTRGGDILTPWRLVHLIREYTQDFGVLIPFRCYSAGTLICLGADDIIMGKMGELGPIDPSVVNAYNPQDPCNPSARVPVNIEDVYSFLALARDKGGLISEAEIARAFQLLAEHIHPLALGNVHRNYLLIRSLAHKLLNLRRDTLPEHITNKIVNNLTEKLYAHNYMISRREAVEDIGLPVCACDDESEKLMWVLYEEYARELSLNETFNPIEIAGGQRADFEVASGIVESEFGQDAFIFTGMVERRDFAEGGSVNVNIMKQGWRTVL